MADQMQVVITGKDGVSRVFQEVGKSAQTAGKQVEAAGKQGEQGFKRIGDGAKSAKVSLSDFAGALTVLGAGLAYAGNAALNQQQTMIGLKAAFGDAADEYIRFADELASRSIFNDDDIMRGERYFATLKNNYDLTDQQIRQLMETTADLASAYGTSFEDASSRITAAIRGEGEAAEYLGLTMNQQSIDRDNLTLKMSNQEAAQFRLNAMYQQTAVYQGTAQKLAESEVGTRARLTNAVQDNAQALGNMIGPMGSMIAGLGFAATGVSSLIGPLGKLGNAAKGTQAGITALSVATNPLTVGFAVAAAGGLYLWKVFEDGKKAAQSLKGALEELNSIQNDLLLSGNDVAAQYVANFEDYNRLVDDFAKKRLDAFEALDWAQKDAQAAAAGTTTGKYILEMRDAYELSKDEAAEFADAQKILGAAFRDSRVDGEALNQALTDLFNQFLAGELTYDQYAEAVVGVSKNTAEFRTNLENTTEAMLAQAAAAKVLGASADELNSLYTAFTETGDRAGNILDNIGRKAVKGAQDGIAFENLLARTIDRGNEGRAALTSYGEAAERAMAQSTARTESARAAMEAHAEAVSEAHEAMAAWIEGSADTGQFLDYWLGLNAAMDDTQAATGDVASAFDVANAAASGLGFTFGGQILTLGTLRGQIEGLQGNLTAIATLDFPGVVALTAGLEDASRALDSVLATYGRIDDLGQRSEKAGSIAEKLVGEPGVWAEIDDMLAAGTISQETYNAAVQAGNDIQWSNARVQEDLNQIRRDQLPLLAEEQLAYEANIAALAGLPAEQQRYALALQDTAVQSQIAAQYATAYKASVGEIPEQVATDMIVNTAQADPQIKDILLQMGLLEEKMGPNGEKILSVKFPDGDKTTRSIDELTRSVDALTTAMGGVPPLRVDADTTEAQAKLATLAAGAGIDAIRVPVELDLSGLGSAAGSTATSAADAALAGFKAAQTVNIDLNATDNATPVVEDLKAAVDTVPETVTITVSDGGTMQIAFDNLGKLGLQAKAVDTYDPAITVTTPGAALAIGLLGATEQSARDIPTAVDVAVSTTGAATAAALLRDVAFAANSVPRDVTTTITTRQITELGVRDLGRVNARHGGIPGYAHGGVLFAGGEAGPEIAHFATGGMAVLPAHALYTAPRGTYVSPANATPGGGFGGITVDLRGATFNGTSRAEMNAWAREDLIPALADELRDHGTRYGRVTP